MSIIRTHVRDTVETYLTRRPHEIAVCFGKRISCSQGAVWTFINPPVVTLESELAGVIIVFSCQTPTELPHNAKEYLKYVYRDHLLSPDHPKWPSLMRYLSRAKRINSMVTDMRALFVLYYDASMVPVAPSNPPSSEGVGSSEGGGEDSAAREGGESRRKGSFATLARVAVRVDALPPSKPGVGRLVVPSHRPKPCAQANVHLIAANAGKLVQRFTESLMYHHLTTRPERRVAASDKISWRSEFLTQRDRECVHVIHSRAHNGVLQVVLTETLESAQRRIFAARICREIASSFCKNPKTGQKWNFRVTLQPPKGFAAELKDRRIWVVWDFHDLHDTPTFVTLSRVLTQFYDFLREAIRLISLQLRCTSSQIVEHVLQKSSPQQSPQQNTQSARAKMSSAWVNHLTPIMSGTKTATPITPPTAVAGFRARARFTQKLCESQQKANTNVRSRFAPSSKKLNTTPLVRRHNTRVHTASPPPTSNIIS